MVALRPGELQCERTIIEAARIAGWRIHGERAAMNRSGRYATPIKGDRGFPDLILVRDGEMIAVELKRKPNKVEADQKAWLNALDDVPGVTALVVFVPEQMDAFIATLFRKVPA